MIRGFQLRYILDPVGSQAPPPINAPVPGWTLGRHTRQLAESPHWFPDLWSEGCIMVGKATWKPPELPLPRKTVNQNQHRVPGGIQTPLLPPRT